MNKKSFAINSLKDNFKANKEFVIMDLPFIVNVKYTYKPFGMEMANPEWPVISHFEFKLPVVDSHFTETGYRSHYFSPYLLIGYDDVENAAKDLITSIIKENNPAFAEKIQNKNFQLSLF